jgi:hypothetical protein
MQEKHAKMFHVHVFSYVWSYFIIKGSFRINCHSHKVRIYKEHHGVSPPVGIGTLPTPLSPARGPGGAHSPTGEGWGSPNSDDWGKSLALCYSVVVAIDSYLKAGTSTQERVLREFIKISASIFVEASKKIKVLI